MAVYLKNGEQETVLFDPKMSVREIIEHWPSVDGVVARVATDEEIQRLSKPKFVVGNSR